MDEIDRLIDKLDRLAAAYPNLVSPDDDDVTDLFLAGKISYAQGLRLRIAEYEAIELSDFGGQIATPEAN